jgi:UDPglucose 6-dehydrogenase
MLLGYDSIVSNIGIVGTGYVGLVSAVCFADLGHKVFGYDLNTQKIAKLKTGESPIYEENLNELLKKGLESNNLTFTDLISDLSNCEYVFLCVPTPQDQDGSADLSFVLKAVKDLRTVLAKNSTLVTKSTVPVKSWEQVSQALDRTDVAIVSNPEFLREGTAVKDFFNPDRIVTGCQDRDKAKSVADLYQMPQAETLITDNTTAELIKYASNSFLALKLSFVNDVSALCEKVGANSLEVLKGMGLDSRIGARFTTPGPGWGGSCFPKDVQALIVTSETAAVPMPLLSAAWESNERAHRRFVDLASEFLDGSLVEKTIAVWGLAFKAFTDDVRESPSLAIIDRLTGRGAKVIAYDPEVKNLDLDQKKIKVVNSIIDTVKSADLILVLTEWPEFSNIEPSEIVANSSVKKIIDARGVLSRKDWEASGFKFWGLRD